MESSASSITGTRTRPSVRSMRADGGTDLDLGAGQGGDQRGHRVGEPRFVEAEAQFGRRGHAHLHLR
ncbi:MAG: hypothetical protein R2712_11415 [Vicinamibacterales bacterium]